MRPQGLAVVVVAAAALVAAAQAETATVTLPQQGDVTGVPAPGYPGVTRFLGIPFATAARWMPPGPAPKLPANFQADEFGPICPQLGPKLGVVGSEDCLTINVWTNLVPTSNESRSKATAPVMLWVYGGSFLSGSGSFPVYDPVKIVARHPGMVAVTFNYRLGPLGFLALPELAATQHSTGNYGLEDQRAAMAWVQQNIGAFGGDPTRVTLVGESAGGISTCLHTFSPLSAGLFRAAILESGNCGTVERTAQEAFGVGAQFASHAGCAQADPAQQLACLRGKSVADVFAASVAIGGASAFNANGAPAAWLPVIDGFNIIEPPYVTLLKGAWDPVPILMGANHESFSLFIRTGPLFEASQNKTLSLGLADFFVQDTARIGRKIGALAPAAAPTAAAVTTAGQQILGRLAGLPLGRDVLIAAGSDAVFLCGTRRMALAFSQYSPHVYYYSFRHHPSVPPAPAFPLWMGAYHFAEVPFVFNQPSCLEVTENCTPAFTPEEVILSDRIQDYWVGFIQSGATPNGGYHEHGIPSLVWPPLTPAGDEAMGLNLTLSVIKGNNADACKPWDDLLFRDGVTTLLNARSGSGAGRAGAAGAPGPRGPPGPPGPPGPGQTGARSPTSPATVRSDAQIIAIAVGISLVVCLVATAILYQLSRSPRGSPRSATLSGAAYARMDDDSF